MFVRVGCIAHINYRNEWAYNPGMWCMNCILVQAMKMDMSLFPVHDCHSESTVTLWPEQTLVL